MLETSKDEKLKFITVSISLQSADDFFDIIRKISSHIDTQLKKRSQVKTVVLRVLDLASRVEAAGGLCGFIEKAQPWAESQLLTHLQHDLVDVVRSLSPDEDGIIILIDEADKPPPQSGLGLICKLLTEEMSKRELMAYLCIGLAGLPGLVQKLRDSHESSPRIFHVLDLKPLETGERIDVLRRAMKEASEKNGYEIRMTTEAEAMISGLCEGYPHFLQEFAYCAFEEDSDNVIDVDDVGNSLFAENGAFDQLGKKYFDQYYSAVSSDKYRELLDAMANHLDGWVSRKTLIEESGLTSREKTLSLFGGRG